MNPKIDNYLSEGCGRCPLVSTPECKVNTWREELEKLRMMVLDCGLTEELKWSVPCYTFENSNILLMSAFKDYCTLSFFKGALLKDPENLLIQQTKNTQSTRQLRFTSLQEIIDQESIIRAYIREAIEIEKAGLQVEFKETSEFDMPEEFQNILDDNPELKAAFEALTPGRQRGYLLYFAAPKQSKTRVARVEKYMQKILDGKGFHDK